MDHLHQYQRGRLNHQQPLPPGFPDDFTHVPPPQQPPPPHPLLPPPPPCDFASIDRNQFDFRQVRVPPSPPPLNHYPRFPQDSPAVNRQVIDCFHDYLSPTPPFVREFDNNPRLLSSNEFSVDSRAPFHSFDYDRSMSRSVDKFERDEELRHCNLVYHDWRNMNDFERERLLRCRIDEHTRITNDLQRRKFLRHRNDLLRFDRVGVNDDCIGMDNGVYRDLYRSEVVLGGNDYAVDKIGFCRDENMPVNYVRNGSFDVRSDVLRSPSEFQCREIEGEVRFPEFHNDCRNRVPVVRHVGFDVRSDVQRSPFEFRGKEIEGDRRFPEFYDEFGNHELYVDRDRRKRDRLGRDYRESYEFEPRKNSRTKPSAFHRLQPAIPHSSTLRKKLGKTTRSPHKGKKITVGSLGHNSNVEKDKRLVDLNVSFKSDSLESKAYICTPSSSRVVSDLNTKTVGESPLRARRPMKRRNSSPVPKKEVKKSDNQIRDSPILMKVGIRKVAEMPDISSKLSASGRSGLPGDSNVCCMVSPEGEVLDKDDTKDGFTKAPTASPPSNRKKKKAVKLISCLSDSVPTNTDTGVDVDNVISVPSCGSLSDTPGSLDQASKSNFGDDGTICLAKFSSDIAAKTGYGENQGSSEHMVASLAPTDSVTCDVDTTINIENKAFMASSDVIVYEPLGLSPECDVVGQQCRNVDRNDEDNVAKSESNHSGDEKNLVCPPSMTVSNGDFVSTDWTKLTKISDIEVMNGVQEQQRTDTGCIIINDAVRKRRKLSLKACVYKGGNLTLSSVKKEVFSPERKRKTGFDGTDPNNYSPNRSKKRRSIKLDSAFIDMPVSESCDLCTPGVASSSVPSESLSSVNYFAEETVGVGEVSNSLRLPEDVMVETTNGLRGGISILGDSSKAKVQDKDSYTPVTETPMSSYISESECKRKDGAILIGAENFVWNELIGSDSEVEMAKRIQSSDVHCIRPSYSVNLNGAPLATDMECESNITVDGNFDALSDCPVLCTEPTLEIMTDKPVMLDKPPKVNSLRVTPQVTSKPAIHSTSDTLKCEDSKESESLISLGGLYSQSKFVRAGFEKNLKLGNLAAPSYQPFTQKAASVPSKYVKKPVTVSSSTSRPFSWRNDLTRGKAALSSNQPSPVTSFSKKSLPTIPVKPRTWCRVDNLTASNTTVKNPSLSVAPPLKPSYGNHLKVQDTSYVRKGNSLVRNSVSSTTTLGSSASVSQAKQIDLTENGKLKGSRTTNSIESPDFVNTGGRRGSVEMPKVHPLPCRGKTADHNIAFVGNCTSPLQGELVDGMGKNALPKGTDTVLSVSENPETILDQSLMGDGNLSDGVIQALNVKKVVYVKRKANQLIAASASPELSGRNMDTNLGLSSDNSYYKRRKNQLIRASSESNIQKMGTAPNDSSNSKTQRAVSVYSGQSASKGPSRRVKSLKVPLVWKLGDAKSADNSSEPLRSRQLLTHLLPWKRTTLRRSVWRASATSTNSSSLIKTRKQLSLRNQTVLYVRSGRGFSLKRSKVLSLGGSLKWSKSMEKRSKKVDEEAALAVALSDSTVRQKTAASGISSEAGIIRKHCSHKSVHGLKLHTGERIFRVGVFRYRMDPSRRTLQRIADEEAPDSTTSKTECAKKPYVPKRLLIGSNEYVRIGNGHQLVRDPKRRTRILASEKVRWSLHTARLRLAKKRKFCQFFTRFGRCNKSEGKCPYIHDSSKIAVCTKFLKGLCVDTNCKLTHEVIPDRMPDCSFFLQGSCSHENCPYRHVNVNSKASICESFLRGYCAEGNKCLKKHSYLCPEFEAIGSCPRGSKCKLYHPKKGVSKKGKVLEEEESTKVRYFDLAKPESGTIILEKNDASKNSSVALASEGDFGDYISLDVSDDEMEESTYPNNKVTEFVEQKNMNPDQAGGNADSNTEVMYLSEFDVLCSPSDDTDELSKE